MNISDIIRHLPREPGKKPLVSGMCLERRYNIATGKETVTLIFSTPRDLTLNGGDGHSGFDGVDIGLLSAAVEAALDEAGSVGAVTEFIVRSDQLHAAPKLPGLL